MPRNWKAESEFGLGEMPDPFGNPIRSDAQGHELITGFSDSDAIRSGATSDGLSYSTLGQTLREIYALGEGDLSGA